MLHLAQVRKNLTSGEIELQLLARQKSGHLWDLIPSEVLLGDVGVILGDGVLVLVELEDNQKVVKIQEAKDWVLELVETYLTNETTTLDLVEKELERVEKWRQEITIKSLDLTRRYLELETQKEQIQELEKKLRQQKEILDIRHGELETQKEQVQELEKNLKRQKKILDIRQKELKKVEDNSEKS